MTTPPPTPASSPARRAIVIGGGVGGLASAWRLRRSGWRVTLLEAGPRFGGVTQGGERDGCVLEHGPDSIVSIKPAGLRLIHDLGLDGELQGTDPGARQSFIARGRTLVPVPEGLYLLAPGKLWPFLRSPLLSWPGRLRAGLDLVLPRRPADAPEESLAQFVRRRLGQEALERIAQPLVGGIYTADPERLSLQATMPQFLDMERDHRSLVLALRARSQAQGAATASGPRYSLFVTLRGGLRRLPAALLAGLDGEDLRLDSPATGLRREDGRWLVATAAGELAADRVVLALPAHAAEPLLHRTDPALASLLAGIPYAGVATVNLAFEASACPAFPRGAGFVVPAVERRATVAVTFSDQKYTGRCPPGLRLLRAFVGGALHEHRLGMDDESLVAAVRADLGDLLGLAAAPRWAEVHRWPAAMAQYVIGHTARVAGIRARAAALPGLHLVGNGYEGVGIPDLAAQAEAVVA